MVVLWEIEEDWSKNFVCLDIKFYNGGNLIKCFMWKIGLWILVLVENICIYVVIIIIRE